MARLAIHVSGPLNDVRILLQMRNECTVLFLILQLFTRQASRSSAITFVSKFIRVFEQSDLTILDGDWIEEPLH